MDNLKILEEKVAAAVHALTRFRTDNAALSDKLKKAESETKRLQNELEKAQTTAGALKKMEEELSALRSEREAAKNRISSMLEKLAVLDGDD